MIALDLQCFKLLVFDQQKFVLANLETLAPILRTDGLACLIIDKLLSQPVTGLLVDLAEGHALGRGRGRIERNGTGNQGELQIAFPVRAGCHNRTPTQTNCRT